MAHEHASFRPLMGRAMTIAYSPWEQASAEFACTHEQSTLRVKTASNGAQAYVMQCLLCGAAARTLKKVALTPKALASALPFNEELRSNWHDRRQARAKELQGDVDQAWWDRYNAYLETPQWARRRQLVMARANGRCEGCGTRAATQVHHLTYVRVTQEMLFDLVAICGYCHESVHGSAHGTT